MNAEKSRNKWTFWFIDNKEKDWLNNLIKLTDFDTEEQLDYWCSRNCSQKASVLRCGQDYAVFKSGIRPLWEDASNKTGGRWILYLCATDKDLDKYWLTMVHLMLGEDLREFNDLICGASVNIRLRKNRIALWTQNTDEEAITALGRKIKEYFKIRSELFFNNVHCALTGNIRSHGEVYMIFNGNNLLKAWGRGASH